MKRIACFCIPAHGHTNPMTQVVRELVKRGNEVRFYSFEEFGEKIRATGAVFIPLDSYLPALTAQEENALKRVSLTEMTLQDIRITECLNDFLAAEFADFQPDVVYSDSVCFWGKLNAWKFGVPLVVSTSTFAFNQLSSQYMKHSPAEMADMIFGLPRISAALKKLRPLGYHVKGALSLIQSDNQTDSIVYTSKEFQPYAASYSDHYLFVGPSLPADAMPMKEKNRPLVYISLGTVINDRPDFYKNCIEALREVNADVIISCGNTVDMASLGTLPEHVQVFPRVDQLDVLARADVFLSHCGMNSVSESLYMATPLVLYPQTGEQAAVARRVREIGAGIDLKEDSADGIRAAVKQVLAKKAFAQAAETCSKGFRACPGIPGAAAFIEQAPHKSDAPDPLAVLNKENGKAILLYWLIGIVIGVLVGVFVGTKFIWIVGMVFGILQTPFGKMVGERNYKRLFGSD
ncbi:MAG: glycosyl transferase [Oscillospiraceae bacterium]|nr:glycosyl transferase [Oscillospiraceae bacterium]